jgi:hypothetical protein
MDCIETNRLPQRVLSTYLGVMQLAELIPLQEPAMSQSILNSPAAEFELRFQSLFHEGRALVFPCDSDGRVDLDSVSDRARNNYLFARAMIGRDYAMPFVGERHH